MSDETRRRISALNQEVSAAITPPPVTVAIIWIPCRSEKRLSTMLPKFSDRLRGVRRPSGWSSVDGGEIPPRHGLLSLVFAPPPRRPHCRPRCHPSNRCALFLLGPPGLGNHIHGDALVGRSIAALTAGSPSFSFRADPTPTPPSLAHPRRRSRPHPPHTLRIHASPSNQIILGTAHP